MGYPWQTLVGGHLGRLGAARRRQPADRLRRGPAGRRSRHHSQPGSDALLRQVREQLLGDLQGVTWTPPRRRLPGPVTAKYLGRLAAADVFTADNAYVMFESLRVDDGTLGPFGNHP